MPKETTHQGASGRTAETPKQKAFPDPSQVAHGVDNPDENQDHTGERPMSERERIMADIESRIDEQRQAQIAEQMAEFNGTGDEDDEHARHAEAREEEALENEGLDSREEIESTDEPETPPSRRDELPPEYADDPLADYIVMDEENNRPMFVTKVDGQERYIDLEQARRQIQKQEAADLRLKNAAERQKALDAREAEIARQEAALAARVQTPVTSPSEPAPDVSDQDLLVEAQQFVENMFNNSPDEASASLAQLLANMRHLQNKPAPQVDQQQLAQTTAALVRAQQLEDARQKDAVDGLEKFKTDYPEIMADRALYLYADDMTDSIAEEWNLEGRSFTDSEVMLEAGRRTMEWRNRLAGKKSNPNPPTNNDRHERKRKLRPMPKSRSQAMQQEQQVEESQTPGDIVAEMRKARGQG